jgi:hypothetical protein
MDIAVRRTLKTLAALVSVALSACAGFGTLVPGTSREADVIAMFGAPAERRQIADGGEVLDFPREPEGMQNWRVILALDGTVRSVEQLVDEPTFAQIRPDMTREQVLLALGRPSEEKAYAGLQEAVVSWRYMEFGRRVMFFNAHFDPSGHLKYTSRTPDPAANTGSSRRR